MNSIGLAVRSCFHERHASQSIGTTPSRKTTILLERDLSIRISACSVELLQVHAFVEAGHLLGISVERQGGPLEELAQAALRGLAPARMIDRRIDVRIKSVLGWVHQVPGRRGLGAGELDLYN